VRRAPAAAKWFGLYAQRFPHGQLIGEASGLLLVSRIKAGDNVGARDAAESYARSLARAAPAAQKIEVLGPAEAPLAVIRGRFRFRLLVKAAREADLQAYLRLWLKEAPKPKGDVRLTIDIDPYSFL